MTKLRKLLLALLVAAGAAGAMAAPALADGRDWNHDRDVRAHDWRAHHRPVVYSAAPAPYGYYYPAPAYGYVAPPPVVYAPPALSFDLRLPLR